MRGVVRVALGAASSPSSSAPRRWRVERRVPSDGFEGATRRLGDDDRRRFRVVDFGSCVAGLRGLGLLVGCFPGTRLLEDWERLAAALAGVEVWLWPWPLTDAPRFLGGLGCWLCNTCLVIRLSPGCSTRGTALIRPDLRRPSSVTNLVGPSASIFFHGGDSTFGLRALLFGVVSRTRRRLAGGPSSMLVASRVVRTLLLCVVSACACSSPGFSSVVS
jgi:hypothetical protein